MPVLALDLGRLHTLSAIGEPLRAEIEISQATPQELRSLRAQLATPASFHQAGMEFNPALTGLSASLQTRSDGSAYIALNGKAPIQDSFVDLILETQWATGRLVKNYALLLNSVSDRFSSASPSATSSASPQLAFAPATQPLKQPAPTAASPSTPVSTLNPSSVELNAQRVPVYRFAPVENAPASPSSTTPVATQTTGLHAPALSARTSSATPAQESDGESLIVKQGDTASRIAVRYLAAHVSLDQMLLAMLKANPDAFIDGNVNLIKAGAKLRMPATEEASRISRTEARQTVIAQTRDFAEYARRLAESPLVVGGKDSREMSGKVVTEVIDADAKTPQQDKLTLSKSKITSENAEAKLAMEREAQDTAAQLAALNKNLKDLEALAQTGQRPATAALPSLGGSLPASPDAAAAEPSSMLQQLSAHPHMWPWAAVLLGTMLILVMWIRRKSRSVDDVYSPSYSDSVAPEMATEGAGPLTNRSDIPPQMASIDLNLQPEKTGMPTASPDAFAAPRSTSGLAMSNDDTEQSKLKLAEQLLAKGDQDLAKALILSVASSASGELKARALHLLGQIR